MRDEPASCELTVEETFGELPAPIDAVAIAMEGDAPIAFASARDGTYALRAGATPVRVGPRFEGGLAAIADEDGFAIAGIERPELDAGKTGSAAVLELDRALVPRSAHFVADVGRSSRGIELARTDVLTVAFHDGEVGRSVARIARLDGSEPTQLSREGRIASRPWMALGADDRVLLAWEEGGFDAEQRPVATVMVHRGQGAARKVAETAFQGATPIVLPAPRGLVVAYRDERPRGHAARMYGISIDARGQRYGQELDLGRADGAEPPRLIACMGGFATLSPRSFGESEIIGMVFADEKLTSRTSEHQFYEQGTRFTHVAGVCHDESLVLVVVEQPGTDSIDDPAVVPVERAILRRGRFHCVPRQE